MRKQQQNNTNEFDRNTLFYFNIAQTISYSKHELMNIYLTNPTVVTLKHCISMKMYGT